MKSLILIAMLATSTIAMADNYVNPYVRKDGTYVEGHNKSSADRNPYNNYTTQGNSNPYTGREGTKDPYQVQQQYQQPSYNNNGYDTNTRQRSRY